MSDTTVQFDAIHADARAFPMQFSTLHLATSNAQGRAECSYASFIAVEGDFLIYVSELAAHTANLLETGLCSAMFIESEADARHLFARKRLTLQCAAEECLPASKEYTQVMTAFTDRFGSVMDILKGLNDFHLIRLRPLRGNFVTGFAKAYTLEGDELAQVRHRNETGHRGTPASVEPMQEGALQ
ncbi:pyridoxamine 5'-phosphate oxidase family protein [Burkholderiaceae bacterium DAT-1]|nr:pyridoxamine 5'-phosphate oxidase family protein [Burkholderiaceae bacterium DAT-1]